MIKRQQCVFDPDSAQKVLVTGGAGFIGSYLTEELISSGYTVFVLDDLSTGRLENLDQVRNDRRFHMVTGSVTDEVLVQKLVNECDFVFHLAATVGVKRVVDRPLDTITYDFLGTEKVMRIASSHRKGVMLVSTSEVYGKSRDLPFSEDGDIVLGQPGASRWSYACSKLLDEFLCKAYQRELGMQVLIVRLFNTVGPRQLGEYGMVIPRFFRSALTNEPIRVFGSGKQTRCFMSVHDTVSILLGLFKKPEAYDRIYNVGNDTEVSILDLAHKVMEVTGSGSDIVMEPYEGYYGRGFEDVERRIPDLSRLRETLGDLPETSLEEILREMNTYYGNNPLELEKL